jgi:hypothetical protein
MFNQAKAVIRFNRDIAWASEQAKNALTWITLGKALTVSLIALIRLLPDLDEEKEAES